MILQLTSTKRMPGPFHGQIRPCAVTDCITRLHAYDPGPFCDAHQHLAGIPLRPRPERQAA